MSDNLIQQRISVRKRVSIDIVYTICELADCLAISEQTARQLIKDGEIQFKRVGSGKGRPRILGLWIIEYLNKNTLSFDN